MFAIALILILFLVCSTVFCVLEAKFTEEGLETIRKTKKGAYAVLIVATVVVTAINCVYTTGEQEVAFTMTFGKTSMIEEPGIHFKLPYVTSVYTESSTTQGLAIGYNPDNNESEAEDSLMITSDFNFVNADFYIEYRITDPIAYNFGSNDPEGILKNISQAAIRNTIGLYDVDSVLTTGKGEIESVVKSEIIAQMEQHSTGITIVNVSIQDTEPPTAEVSTAFNAVENAKQQADEAVNNAKQIESEQIPAAEAQADAILQAAQATKTEKINQATQEVAEFNALYNEYIKNPETVKMQLYYDALEDILPNMEIIVGNDSKVIYVNNGEQVVTQQSASK